MATTDDPNSVVPTTIPAAPYPPSLVEAKCYYYGMPYRPLLVARSSTNVWVKLTGPEGYLIPKEYKLASSHPLREIWEKVVAPAMTKYLHSKGVKWRSLKVIRMGYVSESPFPVIVWMGVVHDSLSAEEGIEVATHCKGILSAHDIDDVHVEICESGATRPTYPANDTNSGAASTAPYPPSSVEAGSYYYGIPSWPLLIARSSTNVWVAPENPDTYHIPKESRPIGLHPLREIWEVTVGPAMIEYLNSKEVKWTSLDPVRIGHAEESSPPVIVWIGVVPGSLYGEDGVEIATHCRGILSAHGIDDVHVEIRESVVIRFAGPKMYKHVGDFNPTVKAREPFCTTLSLPICAEATPSIEGNGGFFISDPRNPGGIYLVTARHIVFHPDDDANELYQYHNSGQHRRNVLLFGDSAIEKYIKAIETEISGKHIIIEYLERRLQAAEQMDEDEEGAEAEKNAVLRESEEAREAIVGLQKFLADVSRDWKDRENRVIGHVVLSPPIGANGEDGFIEDWAVIEIESSKINSTNFVGNVIDLGTTIPIYEFCTWMCPANPRSFEYPVFRLLTLDGTIPDEEVWKPDSELPDNDSDIMVMKRGYASDLTVGRINNIRSFTRVYSNGQPGPISKEVTILPRNSKSGSFSRPGDSGSVVIDGKGRVAGLLIGGAGDKEESDCTYITSIHFLLNRMSEYGLEADLSPSLNA